MVALAIGPTLPEEVLFPKSEPLTNCTLKVWNANGLNEKEKWNMLKQSLPEEIQAKSRKHRYMLTRPPSEGSSIGYFLQSRSWKVLGADFIREALTTVLGMVALIWFLLEALTKRLSTLLKNLLTGITTKTRALRKKLEAITRRI